MNGAWSEGVSSLMAEPLFWLAATLLVYRFSICVGRATKQHPLFNPVLVSVVCLLLLLTVTRTSYGTFMQGAQYVNVLLGPATVALGVPLYRSLSAIRSRLRAAVPAVMAGAVTSSLVAALIARVSGASPLVEVSLLTHSVTTPIAIGVSTRAGGDASLAATFTVLTAVVTVLCARFAMRLAGVRDVKTQGLAAGTTGHGLAVATMIAIDGTAGAFASFALGLNGVVTSALVPVATHVLRMIGA
jgi:putative effector of murein hydrolase